MTLSIRNPEVDALAKRLARPDDTKVTGAGIMAIEETVALRMRRETPMETARRLLAEHGLSLAASRQLVPEEGYHELVGSLFGGD